MDERQARCLITATDAAIDALDSLSAEHGPLILHITAGGDDSGTVDVFEMRSHMDSHFRSGSFAVDVSPGLPVEFSLTTRDHLRFVVKDSDQFTMPAATAEATWQSRSRDLEAGQ